MNEPRTDTHFGKRLADAACGLIESLRGLGYRAGTDLPEELRRDEIEAVRSLLAADDAHLVQAGLHSLMAIRRERRKVLEAEAGLVKTAIEALTTAHVAGMQVDALEETGGVSNTELNAAIAAVAREALEHERELRGEAASASEEAA